MFDKTFFKLALGFLAIIVIALGALYVAGRIESPAATPQDLMAR